MSIVGYQSADGVTQKYYGSGNRFNSFNLTLGVPIFSKAAKNKVKAGQLNEEVARMNVKVADQQLKSHLVQLSEEWRKKQQLVSYYEQAGLVQSELIISHAKQSLEQGQISYLEWTMLMNNAVGIQLARLDAIQQLNTGRNRNRILNRKIKFMSKIQLYILFILMIAGCSSKKQAVAESQRNDC